MICPKCRTKYPEGITVCPNCEVELIALLGAADAPADDDIDIINSRWKDSDEPVIPQTIEIYSDRSAEGYGEEEPEGGLTDTKLPVSTEPLVEEDFNRFEEKKEKLQPIVVDEDDEFSAVVYKSFADEAPAVQKSRNGMGIFLLILSLLFIAASAVMFYMGRSAVPDSEAASIVSPIASAFFAF